MTELNHMGNRFAEPDIQLAQDLFAALEYATRAKAGVERDSYGKGEAKAHQIMADAAGKLGMDIRRDAASNLYMTLRGQNPDRDVMIGSHLDSVPAGGNFDGAAGVILGLAVAAGFRRAGLLPPFNLVILAIRAEESTWFDASYIGSRAALGMLAASELETVKRSDSGRGLGTYIVASGGDLDALRRGEPQFDRARIIAFVEPHIEQGPFLERSDMPLAIVSGIRGSFRYRNAVCHGTYSHSGATPRAFRQDAVSATAQLVYRLDQAWASMEQGGHDLTVTFGKFATDPHEHAFSKVAGRVDFCIDVRSASSETLVLAHAAVEAATGEIEQTHGVKFVLGEITRSAPASMSPQIVEHLRTACRHLGYRPHIMASGAGHDAAVFASAGIPTGMIFIRNANGSHNPDEVMELSDFAVAAQVVCHYCMRMHP